MTKREFLKELRKTRNPGWYAARSGLIRTDKDVAGDSVHDCPITAVARARGYDFDVGSPSTAASAIGLSANHRRAIVDAADNRNGSRFVLRMRIRFALGI